MSEAKTKDPNEYTFVHPKTGEEHTTTITMDNLQDMVYDVEEPFCSGPCQCTVEPDGICPNGWPSVLRAIGIV